MCCVMMRLGHVRYCRRYTVEHMLDSMRGALYAVRRRQSSIKQRSINSSKIAEELNLLRSETARLQDDE